MKSKVFEFLIVLVFLFILPISLVNIIPGKAATKSQVARRVDEIFEDAAKPEPNEPQKVSLDFIPTWPEYIKLEKDLWIGDYIDGVPCGYLIEKGTKVYFREDE